MAKYKLLPGFDPFHDGEIFDINNPIPKYLYWNYLGSWDNILEKHSKYFELVPEETMCEKTITLSLDKAKKMYGKSPEMDELLLANFTKDELNKKELPKSWSKLKYISGFYLSQFSVICDTNNESIKDKPADFQNYNIFATEKQAKSALAMAQLSQLMAVYNDGWEADFEDSNNKYCIERTYKRIIKTIHICNYSFLAFKSEKLRDEFLRNFEPLIKEYFMID